MAKRKKPHTHPRSNILTYIAWFLAVVALMLSALLGGYFFGYDKAKKEIAQKETIQESKRLEVLKRLEEVVSKQKEESVAARLKEVLKKESKSYATASHEYDDATVDTINKETPPREIKKVTTKPKLAIIIDDVSIRSHVNAVKSLNIPITMSFLPPSKARPNSAALAKNEQVYMVHLPMEAKNFSAEEPDTLRIEDSQQKIMQKIKDIKTLFPRVEYINNHTGSLFTSNEIAMNKLVFALNKEHIYFIDSRTTAETMAPKVMQNYGLTYMSRDVFLDHKVDKEYIKGQILQAIKMAKLHGSAIAIGHPHANTIMALSESKNLFKDVELVYINRLY